MDVAPDAVAGCLTAGERAALRAWALAHPGVVAYPLLTECERRRLAFVRWRREKGLVSSGAVAADTEALCVLLMAWRPPAYPVWQLCTPWDSW